MIVIYYSVKNSNDFIIIKNNNYSYVSYLERMFEFKKIKLFGKYRTVSFRGENMTRVILCAPSIMKMLDTNYIMPEMI